jgi:hypothetical protein
MYGEEIKCPGNMKYLGVEINSNYKNTCHIKNRKMAAHTAIAKLTNLGFTTANVNYNMRGFLYKTFVRPLLFYGLENLTLSKFKKIAMTSFERNIIKRMMNINT